MKSIIYAGIGLFAAASVYGITDYYSSSSKGKLDALYKEDAQEVVAEKQEEKKPVDVTTTNISTTTEATVASTTKKVKVKIKKKRRSIRFEDFSRAAPPRDIIEIKELKTPEPVKVEVKPDVQ